MVVKKILIFVFVMILLSGCSFFDSKENQMMFETKAVVYEEEYKNYFVIKKTNNGEYTITFLNNDVDVIMM